MEKDKDISKLNANDLIQAYANGYFPMAEDDGTIYWYSPEPRAIIPIDTYKPSKSLHSTLRKNLFEIRIDTNFESVMRACSKPRSDAPGTWISEALIETYCELNRMGFAHSVEAYQNDILLGGLYGVALGAAFFGESMFFLAPNASKVAFHHLISILKNQGFELLDTQFMNDNVKRYGAIEIPKAKYIVALKQAIAKPAKFSL